MSRVLALAAALSGAVVAVAGPQAEPAHRVAVRYQDGGFSVISISDVETVLPGADALPETGMPLAGFWYELQDSSGVVRYRRVVGDPIRLWREPPAGPAPTADRRGRRGTFATETGSAAFDPGRHVALRAEIPPAPVAASEDGAVVLRRQEVLPHARTFALLVPRARAGDELVLYGSPLLGGYQGDQPATEVARLALGVE